jgi:hypothetical protein
MPHPEDITLFANGMSEFEVFKLRLQIKALQEELAELKRAYALALAQMD